MRCRVIASAVVLLCGFITAQDREQHALPDRFEIERHTFIDVGPPNGFYE
jgi:hypothetical protein